MRNLVVAKLFNCVADCVPKVQNLAEAVFFFVLGNYVGLNFNAPGYNLFERFRIVFRYAPFENLKKLCITDNGCLNCFCKPASEIFIV